MLCLECHVSIQGQRNDSDFILRTSKQSPAAPFSKLPFIRAGATASDPLAWEFLVMAWISCGWSPHSAVAWTLQSLFSFFSLVLLLILSRSFAPTTSMPDIIIFLPPTLSEMPGTEQTASRLWLRECWINPSSSQGEALAHFFLNLLILVWALCAFKSSISSVTSSAMWAFLEALKTNCILESQLALHTSPEVYTTIRHCSVHLKTCKKDPGKLGKWFGALGWAQFSWCSFSEALSFLGVRIVIPCCSKVFRLDMWFFKPTMTWWCSSPKALCSHRFSANIQPNNTGILIWLYMELNVLTHLVMKQLSVKVSSCSGMNVFKVSQGCSVPYGLRQFLKDFEFTPSTVSTQPARLAKLIDFQSPFLLCGFFPKWLNHSSKKLAYN